MREFFCVDFICTGCYLPTPGRDEAFHQRSVGDRREETLCQPCFECKYPEWHAKRVAFKERFRKPAILLILDEAVGIDVSFSEALKAYRWRP